MEIPSYWKFHGRPVRIVRTEDGGLTVEEYDPKTQAWEQHLTYYAAILEGDPDADELTEADFEHWIGALRAGASQEAAWASVLARSSSLIEGVVEALEGQVLYVQGTWWKARGGLTPMVRVGDWVHMRLEAEGPVITEVRPAQR